MFMHIAPEASSFQETTSTLKFATRVNEITLGQVRRVWLGGTCVCLCFVGEQEMDPWVKCE
jgi:hypothetical protein